MRKQLNSGMVYNDSDLPVNNPLVESKWAVIAVREVVAKDLDYKSAYELMLAKTKEDSYSHGLAIVINEVAERLLERNVNA
jgi:hypothetical protein